MAECEHMNFQANVKVGRLTHPTEPIKFHADICIECTDCKMPFHFIGFDMGMSFKGTRISVDGCELRAAIAPGPIPLNGLTKIFYEV